MLFKLLRYYFRETWNSHNLLFLGMMLLLTALLFSGLPMSQDNKVKIFEPVSLSLVDDDHSLISYTLIDQFSDLDVVKNIYVESLESARQRLAADEILLILVVPANFYEDTVSGTKRSSITVYLNERMPSEAAIFARVLNNTAGSVTAMQSALFAYQDLIGPLYADPADLSDAIELAATNMAFRLVGRQSILQVDPSSKLSTVFFVLSALSCLLAMLTGLIILTSVQQERRLGLRERLILAGVSWWQPMLAKQLIGLLWLIAGFAPLLAALFQLYPHLQPGPVLAAVILLYWIMSLLAQILGLLGRPGETMLLAAWLGLFGLLLIGGCIYPWQLLPDWLQSIGLLSPARWGYQLIYRSLAQQPFQVNALVALGSMAAIATAGSWLAWRQARPAAS
jgi:ABC-2 type transport system permease protein